MVAHLRRSVLACVTAVAVVIVGALGAMPAQADPVTVEQISDYCYLVTVWWGEESTTVRVCP